MRSLILKSEDVEGVHSSIKSNSAESAEERRHQIDLVGGRPDGRQCQKKKHELKQEQKYNTLRASVRSV
jgi:hypothetical protein